MNITDTQSHTTMKYKLTNETITTPWNKTLFRIQAMRDIPRHDVKSGDFGGYVENENNLSQEGDSWVSDNAWVFEGARVFGNALVSANARVYGNAQVYGNTWVFDNAWVYGDAFVSGDTIIH